MKAYHKIYHYFSIIEIKSLMLQKHHTVILLEDQDTQNDCILIMLKTFVIYIVVSINSNFLIKAFSRNCVRQKSYYQRGNLTM